MSKGWLVQAVAVATVLAGVPAVPALADPGPGTQPAAGVGADIPAFRGDTGGGANETSVKKIKWHSCPANPVDPEGVQCARFRVPWDWNNPDGRSYSLALRRLPALKTQKPNRLKRTLFINPGGPGGSGTELLVAFADMTALRKHFNIVGWDPRGVPTSKPLLNKCPNKPLLVPATGSFTWKSVADAFATEADTPACISRNRDQLRSLGTNNVIQDLDAMRQAVGDPKLTYLGYSYGTTIGRLYAMRYPDKIRALVMDGTVMPYNTMNMYSKSSIKASNAAWKYLMGLVGSDIKALGNQVSDYLQDNVVQMGSRQITRWGFWGSSLSAASRKNPVSVYTDLVCAVANAAGLPTSACPSQSQSTATRASRLLREAGQEDQDEDAPIVAAVRCTDYIDRPTSSAVTDRFVAAGAVAQTAGNIFNRSLMCTGWPSPNPVPNLTSKVTTSTPLLFVNGIADQATGYWGAQQTAKYFKGHRFITVNTGQHGLSGQGASSCIEQPVERYLISRKLPAKNLYCQQAN